MADSGTASWDDAWVLVPARGGSRGVPGKNLKMLGDRPLILHVLSTLETLFSTSRLVVSTDDDEIDRVCADRAVIHRRSPDLATNEATLDDVALEVGQWLIGERGAAPDELLLTVQPTSPFLGSTAMVQCVERLRSGSRTALTVRDDRHLRWTVDEEGHPRPLYDERVNRQRLPPTFTETGGIIGTRLGDLLETGTRIGEPISLVELPPEQALDIDTHQDWAIAEFLLRRRSIVIRADGSRTMGMGHIYRALALAYELSHHQVTLATRGDGEFSLGSSVVAREPYAVEVPASDDEFIEFLDQARPDITILDVLDTTRDFASAAAARSGFLVTIEDLGPGNRVADLVINDLYTDLYPQENHWYGVRHAILARPFDQLARRSHLRDEPDNSGSQVRNVLLTFGGTDEGNLTARALEALAEVSYDGRVTVVLGPGYRHGALDLDVYGLDGTVHRDVKDMVSVMCDADLAITSAGRTVTELMVVGVPTLVLCQNLRELRHTHASSPFGVMNLGLGEYVPVTSIAEHVGLLLGDASLRADMRRRAIAAVRGRSNEEICRRMLACAEETLRNVSSSGAPRRSE